MIPTAPRMFDILTKFILKNNNNNKKGPVEMRGIVPELPNIKNGISHIMNQGEHNNSWVEYCCWAEGSKQRWAMVLFSVGLFECEMSFLFESAAL